MCRRMSEQEKELERMRVYFVAVLSAHLNKARYEVENLVEKYIDKLTIIDIEEVDDEHVRITYEDEHGDQYEVITEKSIFDLNLECDCDCDCCCCDEEDE